MLTDLNELIERVEEGWAIKSPHGLYTGWCQTRREAINAHSLLFEETWEQRVRKGDRAVSVWLTYRVPTLAFGTSDPERCPYGWSDVVAIYLLGEFGGVLKGRGAYRHSLEYRVSSRHWLLKECSRADILGLTPAKDTVIAALRARLAKGK